MSTVAISPKYTQPSPYPMGNGRLAPVEPVILIPAQTLAEGVTLGDIFEVGARGIARLAVEVSAKSGTNPTLDVTIMHSPNGVDGWASAGTFTQRTSSAAPAETNGLAGLVMSAVTSAGTTPPTITLSGTQLRPVNLRIECTTLGARGTAVIRYSIDGGKSWVSGVTTAATISVVDPNGTDTGLVINYANAAAAVDNVWTATTVGYERKVFAGLDRFVRISALIGGSSTPTMTATVSGELL